MTKWLGVRRDGDYYDDDGHLATEIEYIDDEKKTEVIDIWLWFYYGRKRNEMGRKLYWVIEGYPMKIEFYLLLSIKFAL